MQQRPTATKARRGRAGARRTRRASPNSARSAHNVGIARTMTLL